LDQGGADVGAHVGEHVPQGVQVLAGQHPAPVLGHEDQVHVEGRDDVPAWTVVVLLSHRPSILSGMLVRYRCRIYPNAEQRRALARAFGCARVVSNDALRQRERAHAAGERPSDTEVQRRVVTPAKTTPERAWLGEVASVAMCRRARTPAARTATGSTRCPALAKAAGSVTLGSGPSTVASRSGSPATASPCTGPGATSPRLGISTCAGRVSCHPLRPASPSSASRTVGSTPPSWWNARPSHCPGSTGPPASTLVSAFSRRSPAATAPPRRSPTLGTYAPSSDGW